MRFGSDDHIQICLYNLCNTQKHAYVGREMLYCTHQQRSCVNYKLHIMYRCVFHKTFAEKHLESSMMMQHYRRKTLYKQTMHKI